MGTVSAALLLVMTGAPIQNIDMAAIMRAAQEARETEERIRLLQLQQEAMRRQQQQQNQQPQPQRPVIVRTESAPAPSHRMGGTAMDLVNQCSDPVGVGPCLAYVAGIAEAVILFRGIYKVGPFCVPDGATEQQAALIVVDWAAKHPEELHLPKRSLVVRALANAFPCGDVPKAQ